MSGIWLVSYLALWLLALLLLLAVFTMARQIGLLHTRLGPSGARMTNAGPEIGDMAPQLTVLDLDGQEMLLGGLRERPLLMLFITSACTTCVSLAPSIRALWNSDRRNLDVLLVSLFSTGEAAREFARRYKLAPIPCTTSEVVGFDYKVLAPPYGILVDVDGVVRAKGIVNNNEHLESLVNVLELGHPSMQDWRKTQLSTPVPVANVMPVQ